jgi:hypothetical protein
MNSTNSQYSVHLDSFSQNNSQLFNIKTQLFNDKFIDINSSQSNTLNNSLYDANGFKLLSYELLDQLGPFYEEVQRILDGVPGDTKKNTVRYITHSVIF